LITLNYLQVFEMRLVESTVSGEKKFSMDRGMGAYHEIADDMYKA